MVNKKYVLNLNNKKIHFINGCYSSNEIKIPKEYYTIEEAKAEYPQKVTFCKRCFVCEEE